MFVQDVKKEPQVSHNGHIPAEDGESRRLIFYWKSMVISTVLSWLSLILTEPVDKPIHPLTRKHWSRAFVSLIAMSSIFLKDLSEV